MNLITQSQAPVFEADGTTVTGYAAPSRGATETSAWQVELAAGSGSPVHRLDREEVFLGLAGEAIAVADGVEHVVGAGDCLIVPAGTAFAIAARHGAPFRAHVCLPCGARATVAPNGPSFVPPWAQ